LFSDPSDEELSEALRQYAKEKLTVNEKLDRLRVEFKLVIKWVLTFVLLSTMEVNLLHRKTKLMELNCKFNVSTPKKPPPADVATQAILEKVAADPAQRNGVGAIGTLLSNEGMSLPR
jgi:hypothetical protein